MAQFDDAPGTVRLRDQAFGIQLNQAGIAVRRIKNCFDVNPVMVKEALVMMGRIGPGFRLPLCETTPEKRERMRRTLAGLGLVKEVS